MPINIDPKIFRELSLEKALEILGSSNQGLTTEEAIKRQLKYGLNKLPEPQKRALIAEALLRAINPLSGILLIASILSAYSSNIGNALIIAVIVFIGIALDYFQSYRALIALKQLRSAFTTKVTALRNGKWSEILSKEIVPGDIIQLMAGDLILADALLLTTKDLHVQQAALTGESLPVEKGLISGDPQNLSLVEFKNIIFSGSSVVSGNATALVYATGKNTLLGEMTKNLNVMPPPTDFENGINQFGLFIFKIVMFLILFIFLISIYFKRDVFESFLFSTALAVGLTPEFLPMIIMVTLGVSAIRLSRKKIIIKNLASIQNLGSIDILCSDKTGTLTTGKMILEKHLDILGNPSPKLFLFAYLNSLNQSGIKNPIDEAILNKASADLKNNATLKCGYLESYIKVDEIPFDFERRRSTVVVSKDAENLLIVKGAPEHVFKLCRTYEIEGKIISINASVEKNFFDTFELMSQEGYRLLAIAYRKIAPKTNYNIKDERELTFLGFLIFLDPPLSEAAEVIKSLFSIGVQVKILTGDNELVAQNLCNKVGIDSKKLLLGKEIEVMSDSILQKNVENITLYARVTPNQKQRIISALRKQGHHVGFMGDGINDAASMHISDVGIAVSNAVDIAKEAANIILLENKLKVLLSGILEGRKAFGNVMKYLMMATSSNFGNMFSMAVAIPFLPFLPMSPSQILLNNLLYDISQISIPTDKADPQFVRKPHHWNVDIIKRFMLYIGPISSIFDFLTFYGMLKIFSASEALFQTAWFIESLITQTLVVFIIRTVKNPFSSRPSGLLILSVFTVVFIGISLPFSPIANFLGFVPLPASCLLFLGSMILTYLTMVQFIKQKLMSHWVDNQ